MRSQQSADVSISVPPHVLEPLVQRVVTEALAQFDAARPSSDRIAYSEQEAAALLGLEPHQLRDERYRGRLRAYRVVGGRVRYLREDLLAYATSRRWKPKRDGSSNEASKTETSLTAK